MLLSNIITSTALLISLPGVSAYSTKKFECIPGRRVSAEEQAINFSNFVQTLYIEKNVSRAFNEHALESYIQHNPLMTSGRQTTIDFLSSAFPGWNITVKHQAFQDDIGWIHWKLEGYGTARYNAVVDVFRYEDGCIAEHWDAIQAAPGEDRVNPLELI
ncbi:uncharacterized protein CTRU02_207848 [Colletotrichum truncatum]|uniref:Uncharacterized protein n=1 Tax=Colletotrichum truncatum TaxID=5467 RepID=A0ACC3Z212_COLTU|nr:uncharacterized protein CTRU02_15568 [Colletotrichum truncatum]KAF6780911.1 hypothetical protein CTRU02_15568 [Colletotrichum truncatum]